MHKIWYRNFKIPCFFVVVPVRTHSFGIAELNGLGDSFFSNRVLVLSPNV